MRCLLTCPGTAKAVLVLSILVLLATPGTEGQSLNATLVSSANDLANALSNFHVNNIYINGELRLLRSRSSVFYPKVVALLGKQTILNPVSWCTQGQSSCHKAHGSL